MYNVNYGQWTVLFFDIYSYFMKSPDVTAHSADACARNYVCSMRTRRSNDPQICQNFTSWELYTNWEENTVLAYC